MKPPKGYEVISRATALIEDIGPGKREREVVTDVFDVGPGQKLVRQMQTRETFTWTCDWLNGINLVFDVTGIRQAIADGSVPHDKEVMPLTAEVYQHLITSNSPDEDRVRALPQDQLDVPAIGVFMPTSASPTADLAVTLIDGTHRAIARYRRGLRDLPIHLVLCNKVAKDYITDEANIEKFFTREDK